MQDLITILAEIPEDIPVSRYFSESQQTPRVVWNETNITQYYGSNQADAPVRMHCVIELVATPDTAHRWVDVAQVLRRHRIPFQCPCGIEENTEYVTYDFNVEVEVDEEILNDDE